MSPRYHLRLPESYLASPLFIGYDGPDPLGSTKDQRPLSSEDSPVMAGLASLETILRVR